MKDIDETLNYPKGTCLVMTYGEYSDFCLHNVAITIMDCDMPSLARQFRAECRNKQKEGSSYEFPAWLVTKGYLMWAEYQELHLGEDNDFDAGFDIDQEYRHETKTQQDYSNYGSVEGLKPTPPEKGKLKK